LVLFVGWEGVGLASYFLINFWYTRISANLAGIKAFLTNRFGDWGLTLGLLFYWVIYGSFDIEIQNISTLAPISLLILIVISAIAKSAQIGLHSWLTRSMEGPTPVSALLHAATMVTAGVYL
jgi:NADH-ubiquinone oxidoreductase chain 5